MTANVWQFNVYDMATWRSGMAIGARCSIGKKLLRVLMTHGDGALTANQLGFSHGAVASPLLPGAVQFVFDHNSVEFVPTNWEALSQGDMDAIQPGMVSPGPSIPMIPDLIGCNITSDAGTSGHPCPDVQAWADAFANSPANATW